VLESTDHTDHIDYNEGLGRMNSGIYTVGFLGVSSSSSWLLLHSTLYLNDSNNLLSSC
jgi:hypothetical protein